jgi:4-diphosphocytidyl-2-C-methyl-D-erythritol kinase
MVSFPLCKINLGLYVTGKRQDGYHDLITCFYPVPWCDVLEVIPAETFSFSSSGIDVPGDASDNLCVRAYEMLKSEYDLRPVSMYLLKILPIGAGLGGGSSDGAYTLKALARLFDLPLTAGDLRRLAARLGSDCAFFIEPHPSIGTGRGEQLSPVALSLKGKYLVVVKPPLHISTAQAFSRIAPRTPDVDLREIIETRPVDTWKHFLRNDFEAPLFAEFPVLAQVREKLYSRGALYAGMSGSGAALYGIFDGQVRIEDYFRGMTYWSGFLD